MRRHRPNYLLVALATLLLACALPQSPAQAGTYTVQQCHAGSGYAVAGGWYWGANGFPSGLQGCTNAFRMYSTGTGGGQYLWWSTPQLSAPLKFTNVSFVYDGNVSGGSAAVQNTVRFCTAGAVVFGVCTGHYAAQLFTTSSQAVNLACNIADSNWGECDRAVFELANADGGFHASSGSFFFREMAFTIDDPAPPTASIGGGTLLPATPGVPAGQWNRGVVTTTIGGSDTAGQGGIKAVSGFADGDPSLAVAGGTASCNYTTWNPCPTGSTLATDAHVDTGMLTASGGDGMHTYTARAVDAGGNVSTRSLTFYVDNTAPSTPADVELSGGTNGWNNVNSFGAGWTNPTEQDEDATHSGIAYVKADVQPTDPATQSDPAPVVVPVGGSNGGVSATKTSVTGIAVPGPGAWTLRLSVIDKAGNESAVGGGGGDGASSDYAIGYDPNPPARPNGRANGWISRDELAGGFDQEWTLTRGAGELAPICGFAGSISLNRFDDPGTAVNIPGDVRKWRLPASLSEADHWVHLRAVSCAGLASAATEHVEAKVDLTDPVGTVSGVQDGHWYQDGQVLHLHGDDALSGMQASTSNNHRDGAYLDYSINGLGPADPPRGGDADVPVTGEGAKTLSFAPVDLAGNEAPSQTVRFGIDATAPAGHFEPRDPNRPTLLTAPVGDALSGVALALIEVRPASGGQWRLLPTSLADLSGNPAGGNPTSAVASARFPDTALPAGDYVARLRAHDQAGNELVTSTDEHGRAFAFASPMRAGVALSAGLAKAVRTCGRRRGSRCVKKARGRVVFTGTAQKLDVGFKRGAVVQGFLTGAGYAPLAHQPIEVYATVKGHAEQQLGSTATRGDGSYVFKVRPGLSRAIRVYYPGTELWRDAAATAQLGTGARLTMRVSKEHAFTGQTVAFTGKVTSFDGSLPAGGKLVVLQFHAANKWRPAVAVAHTDAAGRFAVRYKFDGAPVKARIVFRAFAPSEEGWNHVASASRRVTMRLN